MRRSFKPGDEAFLFLKSQGAAMPYVFGLNQGVFRVGVDQQRRAQSDDSPLLLASGTDPEIVRRGAVNAAADGARCDLASRSAP